MEDEGKREGISGWKRLIKKENMMLLLFGGLLVLVIAVPSGSKKEKKEESSVKSVLTDTKSASMESEAQDPAAQYEERVEKQLEEVLSYMEGAGAVKVMVTCRNGGEQVVEKDVPYEKSSLEEQDAQGGSRIQKEESGTEATVYRIGEDGGKVPYVKQVLQPEIEGIVVVAQGGGDGTVQKNITDAIQALFPIEAHKIRVVKMKQTRTKG